ncbi:hypothetical protein P344_01380 [Spiroplasma mirum ATCC 29335]|uniref:HTH gntR-type domain-containing protein n=1 Tax=Spiroplasma mirum ATCC 29335 TaxID=838561 RepID=W0GQ70_9MOLU|nr:MULTISPECIES: GntR family transcriptional regulator [Spiroplasma]AHF60681.1 putative transcriptional regulator [Spiroplasma mirum ATCC 29335]AHI57641.1 hypothetical protein P344_01380 [Spiroplasma mirum ATCC 29335]AKM52810.1 GntR family transcriptional regulator [Spiroplasma atrichopogonis]
MFIKKDKNLSSLNSRDYAYQLLKQNILEFVILPGTLISENELSKQLNISRTPIREALKVLQTEGLIDILPQKGSFVSKIDIQQAEDGILVRKAVEIEILKQACVKFDKKVWSHLEKIIQKQEKLISQEIFDVMKFYELNNEFHRLIFLGANHEHIWTKLREMAASYDRIRIIEVIDQINLDIVLNQHKEELEIIKNGWIDKIDQFMQNHTHNFLKTIPYMRQKFPNIFK